MENTDPWDANYPLNYLFKKESVSGGKQEVNEMGEKDTLPINTFELQLLKVTKK